MKVNGRHNCRGELKFKEGDLIASLFQILEISFQLRKKTLIS